MGAWLAKNILVEGVTLDNFDLNFFVISSKAISLTFSCGIWREEKEDVFAFSFFFLSSSWKLCIWFFSQSPHCSESNKVEIGWGFSRSCTFVPLQICRCLTACMWKQLMVHISKLPWLFLGENKELWDNLVLFYFFWFWFGSHASSFSRIIPGSTLYRDHMECSGAIKALSTIPLRWFSTIKSIELVPLTLSPAGTFTKINNRLCDLSRL